MKIILEKATESDAAVLFQMQIDSLKTMKQTQQMNLLKKLYLE